MKKYYNNRTGCFVICKKKKPKSYPSRLPSENYCMPNNEEKCPYVCDNCCGKYITDPELCRSCVLTNLVCDTKNNMCNPAGGCEGVSDECCQLHITDASHCSVCTAKQSK